MPANKQWKTTVRKLRILFSHWQAAVAPLCKRLMVWHDDGVYMLLHVQCILLFRHNTRIQITFTSTLGFVYTSRYIRHSVSTHGAIWCIFLFGYVILQGGAYFPSKMPHTSDSMPKIHEDLMSTLHITQ